MQPKDGVFIKRKQVAAGYNKYIKRKQVAAGYNKYIKRKQVAAGYNKYTLCLTVTFIIVIYSSS
jgi:hypothetical protein